MNPILLLVLFLLLVVFLGCATPIKCRNVCLPQDAKCKQVCQTEDEWGF